MEDAEMEEFNMPLLDFCKVLQFRCETLPEVQEYMQRDYIAIAAVMSHFSTPPVLFRLHHSQLIKHVMTPASQSLQVSAASTKPAWNPLPKLTPA